MQTFIVVRLSTEDDPYLSLVHLPFCINSEHFVQKWLPENVIDKV